MNRLLAPVLALAFVGPALAQSDQVQIPGRAKPSNLKTSSASSLAMSESGIGYVLGVAGSFGTHAGSASGANLPQLAQNYTDLAGLPVSAYGFISLGGVFSPGDFATQTQSFAKDSAKLPGFTPKDYWPATGPETDPDRKHYKEWVSALHGKLDPAKWDPESASTFFDYLNTRFVLLDTDAPRNDSAKASANLTWLKSVLAAADQKKELDAVIILGHRPLVAPTGAPEGVSLANSAEAQALINQHKKVVAYVAGSPGRYERTYIGQSKVHQIIVGNGGGPFDQTWRPSQGPFYGFGIIAVLQTKRVIFVPMVRKPELGSPDKPAPATAAREIVLYNPPQKSQ